MIHVLYFNKRINNILKNKNKIRSWKQTFEQIKINFKSLNNSKIFNKYTQSDQDYGGMKEGTF